MAGAKRRLAAILSADVVGYSRLMGQDDRATLVALEALRATMARHIEAHDGQVLNAPGDALLAEFPSAVGAAQAAADIQADLGKRNADLPENNRMQVRIGIKRHTRRNPRSTPAITARPGLWLSPHGPPLRTGVER